MQTSKYIIKNCPAYSVCGICVNQKAECLCKDYINCTLKQIVEKCKKAQKTQWVNNKKKPYSPSKAAFAREILNLLEIEECE